MSKTKQEIKYDAMLHAVGEYIRSIGGEAIVGGPVSIQHNGRDRKKFAVVIEVFGKLPPKEAKNA